MLIDDEPWLPSTASLTRRSLSHTITLQTLRTHNHNNCQHKNCSKEPSQTIAIRLSSNTTLTIQGEKSRVFQPAPSNPVRGKPASRRLYISLFRLFCCCCPSTCSTDTSIFPFSSSIENVSAGSRRPGIGLPRIPAQTALQHELAKRASISSSVMPFVSGTQKKAQMPMQMRMAPKKKYAP